MRVSDTAIFMGDSSRSQRRQGMPWEEANPRQNGSVIFAGGLNPAIDPVAKRREEARQQALAIVGGAFEADKKMDEDLNGRRKKVAELHKELGELNDGLKEITQQKEALKEIYGIGAEEEQKAPEEEQEATAEGLLKEGLPENAPEQDPGKAGMTEYEERYKELQEKEEDYLHRIEETKGLIKAENQAISTMKTERLKYHAMVDAQNRADQVLQDAGKEIIGMLTEEAKEHVDEEMEENKEEAEKAEEEKEIQEERIESAKDKKEEKEELTEEIVEAAKELHVLDSVETELQDELQKMLNKMKLLEEDLKGAAVDQEA